MRTLFFYIFLLICTTKTSAQINELGVFLGGINYIGDVGPTDYISPNESAFGIIYKWNRSTRHAYRFSYFQGNISSKDLDSKVSSRNLRGYQFKNSIKEFSAGLEFNFLEFDLHDSKNTTTPYVFTGINYFIYDEIYILNNKSSVDYTHGSFAIPMVVGLKTKIFNNFIIGAEIGARYTFTDNLDGSNPKNDNFETLRFGNLNSKDWYVFSGFTLTYTFGENPCFCSE
uniref:type IX secretion system protein PorG n=1 Tax=Flavobacterium sp. TaxID=239 RepID=UPI00404B443A